MPANVESMFSVRQMPWHREGTILPDYPGSWAEARVLAGLDWEPVPADVYLPRWHVDHSGARYEPVEGWQAICRSDTGAVLSVNKDSYTLIGHAEMGEPEQAIGLLQRAEPMISLRRRTIQWARRSSTLAGYAADY